MTTQEQRRRRLLIFGGGLLVVIAAVAVAIAVSSGGSSGTKSSGAKAGTSFAGIPQSGNVLGSPNAKATMMVFADMQCPFCREFETKAFPSIVNRYVKTGKLRVVFQPISFIGSESIVAAKAVAAASAQGKLFDYASAFYANQGTENTGYVTDAFLRRVAAAAGVDAGKALAQANSAFATGRLARADADATRLGVSGTPTLAVSRSGGQAHLLAADALDPQSVARALNAELAR